MAHEAEETEGRPSRASDQALDEWLVVVRPLLEGLPDAVVAAARDGRIVLVNALAEDLFGYRGEELVGKPVQTLWPERVRERYARNMLRSFATDYGLRFSTEAWGLRRDESEFVGEMSWGVIDTSAGPILLAIGRDISRQRATEARLRAVAAMSERALAGADPKELAAEAVELMRSTLSIAAAEVRLADGVPLASYGTAGASTLRLPIDSGDELLVAAARQLNDEDVGFVHALANILATGLMRLRDEERIRHQAVHDPLTGLANRTLLRDRLEHALARSEREGGTIAVLFVDLDNFKGVNDAHGHAAGDEVLVRVARNLRGAVRPGDTIARLGGDEFVVVCEDVDAESALAVARRLQEAIRRPMTASAARSSLSASIGIALGRTDAESLLRNADAAAYRAKARGRGGLELFR